MEVQFGSQLQSNRATIRGLTITLTVTLDLLPLSLGLAAAARNAARALLSCRRALLTITITSRRLYDFSVSFTRSKCHRRAAAKLWEERER